VTLHIQLICHTDIKANHSMQATPDPQAKELLIEAWDWREKLQRSIDGCRSTDDMNAAAAAEYDELPGPHTPLPCGYQVRLMANCPKTPLQS
jgi:hypothetical protein